MQNRSRRFYSVLSRCLLFFAIYYMFCGLLAMFRKSYNPFQIFDKKVRQFWHFLPYERKTDFTSNSAFKESIFLSAIQSHFCLDRLIISCSVAEGFSFVCCA